MTAWGWSPTTRGQNSSSLRHSRGLKSSTHISEAQLQVNWPQVPLVPMRLLLVHTVYIQNASHELKFMTRNKELKTYWNENHEWFISLWKKGNDICLDLAFGYTFSHSRIQIHYLEQTDNVFQTDTNTDINVRSTIKKREIKKKRCLPGRHLVETRDVHWYQDPTGLVGKCQTSRRFLLSCQRVVRYEACGCVQAVRYEDTKKDHIHSWEHEQCIYSVHPYIFSNCMVRVIVI